MDFSLLIEHARMDNRIAGYTFKNSKLLQDALTHSSFANEHSGTESNERLEFLGDSVLSLLCTEHVYSTNVQGSEGYLTDIRSQIVCNESLAAFAERNELGDRLRLGNGERLQQGKHKHAILADAVEAIIGALYLDGGIEAARSFIGAYIAESAQKVSKCGPVMKGDFKSRLQQISQSMAWGLPLYELLAQQGPDHESLFTTQVTVAARKARGTGKNKKESEQAAASAWITRFCKHEEVY